MVKHVRCTHCEGEVETPARAMSTVCPHCNRRLVLEDVRVKTYLAVNELATTGSVVVDKRGHVVAAHIKTGGMIVRGKLRGAVEAVGCVELLKTAQVQADIAAPGLRVESGATIQGFLRIGAPRPKPAAASSS